MAEGRPRKLAERAAAPADRDQEPDRAHRRRRAGENQQRVNHPFDPGAVEGQEVIGREAVDAQLRQVGTAQREPGEDRQDDPEGKQPDTAAPFEHQQAAGRYREEKRHRCDPDRPLVVCGQ